jgi:hypothetical protein
MVARNNDFSRFGDVLSTAPLLLSYGIENRNNNFGTDFKGEISAERFSCWRSVGNLELRHR